MGAVLGHVCAGRGEIDYEEFIAAMLDSRRVAKRKEAVRRSFESLDRDGDGFITVGRRRGCSTLLTWVFCGVWCASRLVGMGLVRAAVFNAHHCLGALAAAAQGA